MGDLAALEVGGGVLLLLGRTITEARTPDAAADTVVGRAGVDHHVPGLPVGWGTPCRPPSPGPGRPQGAVPAASTSPFSISLACMACCSRLLSAFLVASAGDKVVAGAGVLHDHLRGGPQGECGTRPGACAGGRGGSAAAGRAASVAS